MGRKVARRRRRAYVESLIRSEKQQIEKQKEKKQMKEEREFLMDKIFTLVSPESGTSSEITFS